MKKFMSLSVLYKIQRIFCFKLIKKGHANFFITSKKNINDLPQRNNWIDFDSFWFISLIFIWIWSYLSFFNRYWIIYDLSGQKCTSIEINKLRKKRKFSYVKYMCGQSKRKRFMTFEIENQIEWFFWKFKKLDKILEGAKTRLLYIFSWTVREMSVGRCYSNIYKWVKLTLSILWPTSGIWL